MVWFKVDDKLHSHPKTANASLAAMGLWTVAGSWCGEHSNDGRVPFHVIPSLSRGSIELADELVAAGLWRRVRGAYLFHEWEADSDGTKRNPSKTEVAKLKQTRAEAGRKGGLASGRKRSKSLARASQLLEAQTNPDPPPSSEGGSESAPASPGGARSSTDPAVGSRPNGQIPDPDRRAALAAQARAQIRKRAAPARDPFTPPPPDKAQSALDALDAALEKLPSPQPEEAPNDHE